MSKHHHNVELVFFFVNGVPFLHTKTNKIDFRSVQACNIRGKYETVSVLKKVKTKYKNRGFIITDFYCDNQFEHVCKFFSSTNIHTCAANKHIGDIKISIRTFK